MRTLMINAKCSDLCQAVYTVDGKTAAESNGYVPQQIGVDEGGGYGDYVILTIDCDTGQILNWPKPSHKQVLAAIKAT